MFLGGLGPPWALNDPDGLRYRGTPWALVGRALVGPLGPYGRALAGPLGPLWAGPLWALLVVGPPGPS